MERVIIAILIMAVTTYLLRMLPIAIFRKKITNRFFKSFLFYIPYAVLSAMTFPSILYATGNVLSAAAGMIVALITAFCNRGLITVALSASAAAFLVETILRLIG